MQQRLDFDASWFGGGEVGSTDFAQAVADYQRANGLGVDGIAGPMTCGHAEQAAGGGGGDTLEDGVLDFDAAGAGGGAGGGEAIEDGLLDFDAAGPSGAGGGDVLEDGLLDFDAAGPSGAGGGDVLEDGLLDFDAGVQSKSSSAAVGDPETIRAEAAAGVAGSGGALPHLDQIQASFGRHDVSAVQAHVGGAAADASRAIGAEAYATGNHVAFAGAPDLHTAAHEAAHVVQQRAGVQLKGGVGEVGDSYEQHADAVADTVVQGKSAEDLLDRYAGGSESAAGLQKRAAAVQMDGNDVDLRGLERRKTDELNTWSRAQRGRILENGRKTVRAFHRLGETSQWNVQSFSSLEANVVAGVLTAVGLIPGGGTAVAAVASILYNIYSTAENNAALQRAMSASSGAMLNAMEAEGEAGSLLLGQLDQRYDALMARVRVAADAGDVEAMRAVRGDPNFVQEANQERIYQGLAEAWLLRNSATEWRMIRSNQFTARDGVDTSAWRSVRDSATDFDLANQGSALIAGQLEGLLARFGVEAQSEIPPNQIQGERQFTGLRIVDRRKFVSQMNSSIYFAVSTWREDWEFNAGVRIREGMSLDGTRSLDRAWMQHGSAIHENKTSGNNVRRVNFGSST